MSEAISRSIAPSTGTGTAAPVQDVIQAFAEFGAASAAGISAAGVEAVAEKLMGVDPAPAVTRYPAAPELERASAMYEVHAARAADVAEIVEPAAVEETPSRRTRRGGGSGTRRGSSLEIGDTYPIPGFIERLRLLKVSDLPTNDPRVAQVLPLPELLAFIRDTGIVREDALNLLIGDETYVAAIRRGFIDTLLLRLAMFRKRTAIDAEMWLPVAEIHCPEVEGCETVYQWSSEHKAQLRVTLFGSGGGGGLSSELKFKRGLTSKGGCRRLLVRAKVVLEEWRADPDGEVLKIVNVRAVERGIRVVGLTGEDLHRCSADLEQVQQWIAATEAAGHDLCGTPYELASKARGSAVWKEEFEVRKGVMIETTVNAVLHGIAVAVELKSEVIRSFGYSYQLAEPGVYLGFYGGPGSSLYNWAWSQG